MSNLYTTGYQGETINQFVVKLLDNNIQTIIDVRQTPLSRKPGFSKSALVKKLHEYGIRYLHYRELGAPKKLRVYLYSTSDYTSFFDRYKVHASEYSDSIYDLVDLTRETNACVLCFEKDHKYCHRKVLADILEEKFGTHLKVVHI